MKRDTRPRCVERRTGYPEQCSGGSGLFEELWGEADMIECEQEREENGVNGGRGFCEGEETPGPPATLLLNFSQGWFPPFFFVRSAKPQLFSLICDLICDLGPRRGSYPSLWQQNPSATDGRGFSGPYHAKC